MNYLWSTKKYSVRDVRYSRTNKLNGRLRLRLSEKASDVLTVDSLVHIVRTASRWFKSSTCEMLDVKQLLELR